MKIIFIFNTQLERPATGRQARGRGVGSDRSWRPGNHEAHRVHSAW
ncbi:hypothetical protein AKJ09_09470 [Labilithrix luteola]|uniref:Uncharacterized protein n=1 Tax=Labilithrix luteola TaxID=1391654 RepID=A0A0K1QAW9_9BACT|nr:hypothetical protein AKJ09_09470 [Labilithrix luteola]